MKTKNSNRSSYMRSSTRIVPAPVNAASSTYKQYNAYTSKGIKIGAYRIKWHYKTGLYSIKGKIITFILQNEWENKNELPKESFSTVILLLISNMDMETRYTLLLN